MDEDYLKCYKEAYFYYSRSDYKRAIPLFKKAISLNPAYAPSYNELGNIYKNIFDLASAQKYYEMALKHDPESAIILSNLGSVHNLLGNINQAAAYFHKAVKSDPNYSDAYYNLAKIYLLGESWEKAAFYCKKTIELNPNFGHAYSLLAFTKMHTCDWDSPINYNPLFDNPILSTLRIEDQKINYQVACSWSRLIEDKMAHFPKFNHSKKSLKTKKKITIGYLSNDFYPHATTCLISGLFKKHNRKEFTVNIYSYGKNDGNKYIKKFKKEVDKFTDISTVSDYEAAKIIYSDEVDLLIDLKGYTGGSRMEILALKPSPVSITWLGFPGTSGASFVDYILTDKIVTSKSDQKYYTEKFLYLPHTYQPNDSERKISGVKYKRSDFGLPKNAFVFACFCRPAKIEKQSFAIWMRILKRVPHSVLWLLKDNNQMFINLKKEAKKLGVDPKRLIFARELPHDKHLKRHMLADLSLDTFTYNGHTTTSDSLWAEVPVITLKGKHFASRVAASLLSAIGLPELTANTQKEYEDLAVSLAKNPKKYESVLIKLRANKLKYPLFDTARFVKDLEKVYKMVWAGYLRKR